MWQCELLQGVKFLRLHLMLIGISWGAAQLGGSVDLTNTFYSTGRFFLRHPPAVSEAVCWFRSPSCPSRSFIIISLFFISMLWSTCWTFPVWRTKVKLEPRANWPVTEAETARRLCRSSTAEPLGAETSQLTVNVQMIWKVFASLIIYISLLQK